MQKECVVLLDGIGFDWSPLESAWKRTVASLLIFKGLYGHCNVPRGYKDIPQLANTVQTLRLQKKKGTLTEERLAWLESIGFKWNEIKIVPSENIPQ